MTGVLDWLIDPDTVDCHSGAFFGLRDDEIAEMSDRVILDVITSAQRLICRAQAVQARAIHHLATLRQGSRWVADEIAPELGVSRQAAHTQVAVAADLCTRLPAMLAAMDVGQIDAVKARKIAEVTAPLSDAHAREVDARLAGRVAGKDPAGVRRTARRAVQAVDPHGAAERAARRRRERRVELAHEDDAMSSLWAYLPAETGSACYTRIDTLARSLKTSDEPRTLDQLRADVLADLILGKATGSRAAAQVFVHVPLDAALQVSERGCELAGHGPIPAPLARQIMADPHSVWRKVTTDPASGAVLDVGRTRYRPPAALADFARVRDRECRAPGCHRPAHHCDLDHNHEWHHNGRTAACNLCCLCEHHHHHHLKDQPGWHFDLDEHTGELHITTPAGKTHTTRPEPIIEP
ncbi:DUF222 domain-containing protein [Prauserella muralis]|uniref:DUF222 domain-containing protein n=1 Tax=Prauserella muralis TaxID=588067 RepID=UPI002013B663|nr:DUF222 domain-containing protein [Prauserella muralis]